MQNEPIVICIICKWKKHGNILLQNIAVLNSYKKSEEKKRIKKNWEKRKKKKQ